MPCPSLHQVVGKFDDCRQQPRREYADHADSALGRWTAADGARAPLILIAAAIPLRRRVRLGTATEPSSRPYRFPWYSPMRFGLRRDHELGTGILPLTTTTATKDGVSGLSRPCSAGTRVNT